jgi:DNA-binding transcriptional LysR family regulator
MVAPVFFDDVERITVSNSAHNMLYLKILVSKGETMKAKLNTFVVVAKQAGFAKAAKKLGLSKATVTRYIHDLEKKYDTILFTRTTRHVSLTEQGELFLQYAVEALQLEEGVREALTQQVGRLSGHIKIGLPFSTLNLFATRALPELRLRYPELSFELIHGNHVDDLLSSHFDVVLHCGPLPDVNFYYEKIATWTKILCHSPDYRKKYGSPKTVSQLSRHDCIGHADNYTRTWRLRLKGALSEVPVSCKVRVSCGMILKHLAVASVGIAYLPSFIVGDAIKSGELEPILKSAWPEPQPIYVLYPLRKKHNKKLKIVIEAMKALLV